MFIYSSKLSQFFKVSYLLFRHMKFSPQDLLVFQYLTWTVWPFLWSLCIKIAGKGLLLAGLVKHKTLHLLQAIKLLKVILCKIPLYSSWKKTVDNLLSLPSCFWARTQHVLFMPTLASAPTTFPWYASVSTAGFICKRRKKAQVLTSSRKKTEMDKNPGRVEKY